MHVLHNDCRAGCLKLHDFVHQAATKTDVEWSNIVTGKRFIDCKSKWSDTSALVSVVTLWCFGNVTASRVFAYTNICYFGSMEYKVDTVILIIFVHLTRIWGTAVAQWLRCCATKRKVTGSIPSGVSGFFIEIKSFWSHYGPGVDSASNRNEYQEYFLGIKAAGA